MAKKEITIKLTFDYDPTENNGIAANVFLYQLLNRLNYQHPIKEVDYKGKKVTIGELSKVKDLALKKVDSVDKEDLPIVDTGDITPAPPFVSKRNRK